MESKQFLETHLHRSVSGMSLYDVLQLLAEEWSNL